MSNRLTIRHTVFSIALLKRITGVEGALDRDELARASNAFWLEHARQRAYLDQRPITETGFPEVKTAKLHKVA